MSGLARTWARFMFAAFIAALSTSCYSPTHSQRFFRDATTTDPSLEPIYSTAIYTVYFDHILRRCVLHSGHTWGQQGGGGGGTGIGVAAFRCDPNVLRDRARELGIKTFPTKIQLPTTSPRSSQTAPSPVALPAPNGSEAALQPSGGSK